MLVGFPEAQLGAGARGFRACGEIATLRVHQLGEAFDQQLALRAGRRPFGLAVAQLRRGLAPRALAQPQRERAERGGGQQDAAKLAHGAST